MILMACFMWERIWASIFFKENRYFFIDRAQGFTDYNSTMAITYNNSLYIGTKQGFFEVQNDYFNQTEAFADEAVISEIFVNNRSLPKITANRSEERRVGKEWS